MSTHVTAKQLADTLGDELIGRWIMTEQIGEWPGGKARVFAMALDPEAPEIVFNVSQGEETPRTSGVFDYEKVFLLDETFTITEKQHIMEDLTLVSCALPNTGWIREAFDRLENRIAEFEELHKP